MQAPKGNFWNGDCSNTALCTAQTPCSVSGSELLITGASKCTVVWTEGEYGALKVSSNVTLVYSFEGTVASLNLTTNAPTIKYTSFGSVSLTSTLQRSLQTIELSNNSQLLSIDSIAFADTQIALSSSHLFKKSLHINITNAKFSLETTSADSQLFASLLDIAVPSGSTIGSASFSMKNSIVSLSRTLDRPLLRSDLSFGHLEITHGCKVDSPSHVFQVPPSGLQSVTVSNSTISNMMMLVGSSNLEANVSYAKATVSIIDSTISGASVASLFEPIAQFGYGDSLIANMNNFESTPFSLLPSINPSSCMPLIVSGSHISDINMNCIDFDLGAPFYACNVRFENSRFAQNLLCVVGTSNSPSSGYFHNVTIETSASVAKSNATAITRLMNVDIDSQKLIIQSKATNSKSLQYYPPLLEGRVFFTPESSIDTDSLTLSGAHVRLSHWNQRMGQIHYLPRTDSTPSLIEPHTEASAHSCWNFTAPVSLNAHAQTSNYTIDLTNLKTFRFEMSHSAVMGPQNAILNSAGVHIASSNQRMLMDSLRVRWSTSSLDPVPNTKYGLVDVWIPHGRQFTHVMPTQAGDRFRFATSSTRKFEDLAYWTLDFSLVSHVAPEPSTAEPSSCGKKSPQPGNWTCTDGYWVHKTALKVDGNLVLPSDSKSIIHGNLTINGTITFFDFDSILETSGCIVMLGNYSKVFLDFSSDDAVPQEYGTRQRPTWESHMITQSVNCSYALENLKVQIKNPPSCRKIQTTNLTSRPSILLIRFNADFAICNTTYIVIGCSSGAILLLVLLGFLIWCCCHNIKRPGYQRLPTKPTNSLYDPEDTPNWSE